MSVAFSFAFVETAFSKETWILALETKMRGLLRLIEELLIQIENSEPEFPNEAWADEHNDPAPAVTK